MQVEIEEVNGSHDDSDYKADTEEDENDKMQGIEEFQIKEESVPNGKDVMVC